MTSYKELYGPEDTSVLSAQDSHRSEALFRGEISEDYTLRATHATSHIFWSFKIGQEDHFLHPRVLDVLHIMGFYGVARCGCGPISIDNHLVTALVERWRPETHTFHFPVGEATVTLQDVAIIWGLSIDGEPVICFDPNFSKNEWRMYCEMLLGFMPEEDKMKGNSRLYLSALKSHLLGIVITDETDQLTVNQYARGCALLMLGGFMMPDSSRYTVSLLYLSFLSDIEGAGSYSWASAVLAYLYRELCLATNNERQIISGPLSILQIWAWSRILTIQPMNVREILTQGLLFGVDGRNLGLPPYGIRWMQYHRHTHSSTHSVRVYRDIFDRMCDGEPYDMSLPEIESLGPRCITENWMSECPLINICIVEFHHPNRVLRQFGRKQNIPSELHDAHEELHHISFHGRQGCNWTQFHQHWVQYWRQRAPLANTIVAQGTSNLSRDYMQWYRKITRRLISPSHYQTRTGYQPANASARDAMFQLMNRLTISTDLASPEDPQSVEDLRRTSREVVSHMHNVFIRPPYLIDPPVTNQTDEFTAEPSNVRSAEFTAGPSNVRSSTAEIPTYRSPRRRNQTTDFVASTSRDQRRRTSASQELPPYTQYTYSDVPTTFYDTPYTEVPYFPQPEETNVHMTDANTPQDMSFLSLLQSGYPPITYAQEPPHFNSSPIIYPNYEDHNQDEGENHDIRRPTRQRRPPRCGTGGRRC